jgi:hypothetical protein
MSRFIAQFNNGKYINIRADRMVEDEENNLLKVYDGEIIVACVDKSILLSAHISEQGGDIGG